MCNSLVCDRLMIEPHPCRPFIIVMEVDGAPGAEDLFATHKADIASGYPDDRSTKLGATARSIDRWARKSTVQRFDNIRDWRARTMDFEVLDTAQSGERGMELLAGREVGECCFCRPVACSETYPGAGRTASERSGMTSSTPSLLNPWVLSHRSIIAASAVGAAAHKWARFPVRSSLP